MNVSSIGFLVFAIMAAVLHGAWRNPVWRAVIMAAANVAFVLSFTRSPRMLLPFACFLLLGYVAVRSAQWKEGRFATVLFVAGTIAVFCWLKQYWFLSFAGFLPFVYLTVGLSYAFFRVLGMIVDARTEAEVSAVSPLAYFNFAVNFPTLVAGPIDRYQEFARPAQPVTPDDVGAAVQRIALGFLKVLVLSAFVGNHQTQATAALLQENGARAVAQAVLSFGLYPVYLYFNFSGYTDIVLGIGYLFGKRYPENFNAPFSSFNFLDFWSRWHMSLSFWLRDYVYTPLLKRQMQLGLPRAFDPYLGVLAYFVTFFLIGIWHGSTAVFAVYGLLLALGVSVNKLYQIGMTKRLGKKRYREVAANLPYRFVCRGLTYTWYSFCMICFWNSGGRVLQVLHHLSFAGVCAAFAGLLTVTIVVLNLFEESLAALRARLSFAVFGEFSAYARAVVVGLSIFGCMAGVMLAKTVNAAIVYQAF